MSELRRFELVFDGRSNGWHLRDRRGQIVASFPTKESATGGGVLEKVLGAEPASVRIHNKDGKFEEERTFPRSADPRESPG